MEENFKRIADAVRLPEGSRARIRAQIASRAEEQEASMQNKPKKHLPRLAVAAIIIAAALTLTAAAAAVVHRFRNDIIVSSVSELPASTEDTPTAVAVVTDSQSAAQTLDEILAEGPYITAEEWESGEKIGGTTSAQYGGWDTAELISSDPALSVRRITRETDGAVGRYGLYTEIVQALRGYDAFYADFTDGAFRSRAASPVIYRSQTIGAVYA